MRRQAKGFLAVGAALALGAGAVYADERAKTAAGGEAAGEKASASSTAPSTGSSESAATGSAASSASGAVSSQAASKELTGKVLQASPSKLFLEHMGAVVEFNIASDAKFSGGDFRSSSDLQEGQEVRASFTVENKTTNVAKEISLAGAAAGASPTTPSMGTGSGAEGTQAVPGERGSGTSPQERGERSTPGMPPGTQQQPSR